MRKYAGSWRRARLIVDTEAPLTLLTTTAARSLGIAPPLRVITNVQVPIGFAIWRPPLRLGSLRVGDVILEDIEAVVSDAVWRADGVLGQNFLRHFNVTIERGVPNLLLLEARPPAGAPE
jgi:predicted aspartyl protease